MIQVQEIVAGGRDVIRSNSSGRFDGYMVPLSAIRVREGFNEARACDPDYPAHVRAIADSIKANGFMRHKPLTVAPSADGSLYLQDGHTRYSGVLLANEEGAGIEALPVVPESKGTTEVDRDFGLITNNSGRPLTPMGEALVIKRLLGRGVSEAEIARRLAFSPATVAARLTLVAAPEAIKAMVQAGEVSATTAVRAVNKEGAKAVQKLTEAVATAKAQGKTKATAKHIEPKKAPSVHADTLRLEYLIKSFFIVRKCGAVGDQPEGYVCEDSQGAQMGWGVTERGAIDNAMSKE